MKLNPERLFVLQVLENRVATLKELVTIMRWCHSKPHSSVPSFQERLDRLVRRALLVKIKGGKGGRANRYTCPEFLMGLTDKDIAADDAEEHGDVEKAALLRAARQIQTGPKAKANDAP